MGLVVGDFLEGAYLLLQNVDSLHIGLEVVHDVLNIGVGVLGLRGFGLAPLGREA